MQRICVTLGACGVRTTAVRTTTLQRLATLTPFITSSALTRSFHSTPLRSHVHSDWPRRSHQHFRDVAEAAAKAKEAEKEERAKNAEPFLTVDHITATKPKLLPADAPTHFAVFRFRNEQYKAVEDDLLMMNLIDGNVGDKIIVDDVLLLAGRNSTLIGRPSIAGARVELQIEEHTHLAKVIVFKKKRRKGYKRKQGHRQEVSMVRVLSVTLPEGVAPLSAKGVKKSTTAENNSSSSPAATASIPSSIGTGVRAFSTVARSSPATAPSSPLPTPTTNESTIDTLLRRELQASTLQIEDTSGGCGAFFRLLVVSPKFTGLSLVKQHRLVNETLKAHLANLHGLTLTTYTEEQWTKLTQKA